MPLIVLCLALAVFAQGTSEFMLAGLLPAIADDLGVSLATAGLLTSTFAVGMVVGAPAMAVLARRWPPRRALTVLLGVFVAAHVVGALTDSIGVLLATRVVAAVANAGFLAVTLGLVTVLVAPDRRARALAVVIGGTTLALVAGVPVGAVIGSALGWRATMWAVALLCLPALLVVALCAPRRTPVPGRVPLGRELAELRSARVAATLLYVALVNAATFCGYTYLAPVVTDVADLPQVGVPVVLAAFGLGSLAGVSVAGRLADAHPMRLLGLGTVLLTGVWALTVALAPAGWLLVPLALLLGALAFGVGSTSIALAVRNAAGAPTMAGSYSTAALNVGATLGPAAGGLALEAGGRGPFLLSTALVVGAAVHLLLLRRVVRPLPVSAPRSTPCGGT